MRPASRSSPPQAVVPAVNRTSTRFGFYLRLCLPWHLNDYPIVDCRRNHNTVGVEPREITGKFVFTPCLRRQAEHRTVVESATKAETTKHNYGW